MTEEFIKKVVKARNEDNDGICTILYFDSKGNGIVTSDDSCHDLIGAYLNEEDNSLAFLIGDEDDSVQIFASFSELNPEAQQYITSFIEAMLSKKYPIGIDYVNRKDYNVSSDMGYYFGEFLDMDIADDTLEDAKQNIARYFPEQMEDIEEDEFPIYSIYEKTFVNILDEDGEVEDTIEVDSEIVLTIAGCDEEDTAYFRDFVSVIDENTISVNSISLKEEV